MSVSISRAQFLRGRFFSHHAFIRPPWSVKEDTFITQCNTCGACIKACPTSIITQSDGGLPSIDFARGECTFCAQCVDTCTTGALSKHIDPPWNLQVHIKQSCLALNATVCRSCAEHCESQAIRFKLVANQVPQPLVDNALCSGCGACSTVCPTSAIQLVAQDNPQPRSTHATK